MLGRKDWDFVAIQDYQSDMAESRDQALAVIEALRRERDDLKRALILAAVEAGGRLEINESDLSRFREGDYVVIQHTNSENRKIVFEVMRAKLPGSN